MNYILDVIAHENNMSTSEIIFKYMFNIKNIIMLLVLFIIVAISIEIINKLFDSAIYKYYFIGILSVVLIIIAGLIII